VEKWEYIVGIGIQTIIFIGGGWGMLIRNDSNNKDLKEDFVIMREELKKLATVITVQAVQTNRLDNMDVHVASLERRVEDLRRGNGFVKGREGVDREYP
jgi:hypothetical protein